MNYEPPRPYYIPTVRQQREAKHAPRPKKRAVVIPVADWTIAKALFWGRDERGMVKPPNV